MLKHVTLASLILTSAIASAQSQELRGTVTDSMCGNKHMMKNLSVAACTRTCVKSGSDFALAVGDKIYILRGNRAQLDKYAGAQVVVKGNVSGTTVTVEEIKPAS
ncbi:hypothetical protein BH10ACI4_BH10ACI4_06220 [soil metagenome]